MKPNHFIITLRQQKGLEQFAGRGGNPVSDASQAWTFDTMRQADAVAHGYRRDFDYVEVEPVYTTNTI